MTSFRTPIQTRLFTVLFFFLAGTGFSIVLWRAVHFADETANNSDVWFADSGLSFNRLIQVRPERDCGG
jgi:hypothetical protein